MTEKTPDRARLLHEAAEELGWTDPHEVAAFVKRLQVGLPAEDELSVIFNWLGQCTIVHKLDQFPYPPGSTSTYRVPDLLAVFDVKGRAVPVLIEVKTSDENVLSWRPDFFGGLQAYASTVGLPLLVAWKCHGVWSMFDASHMQVAEKNFNISFSSAMRENLLSSLAGDFAFAFYKGVGLHFHIRKLKPTSTGFEGRIEEAYFLNVRGERHTGADGVFQLFACSDHEAETQETDTHAHQAFVVQSEDHMEFAHRALVILLNTFRSESEPLVWRQLQKLESFQILKGCPADAVEGAMKAGFIRNIFHLRPNTVPKFLE